MHLTHINRNRAKSILLINGALSGDNRVLRSLSILSEVSDSVIVYVKGGEKGRNIARYKNVTIKNVMTPKGGKLINALSMLTYNLVTAVYVVAKRPKLLFINDYDTLISGVIVKLVTKVKVLYDNHEYIQDLRYLHRYPLLVRKFFAKLEIWSMKRFDKSLVVSESIKHQYELAQVNEIEIVRNIPDFSGYSNIEYKKCELSSYISKISDGHANILLYMGTNFSKGRGLEFSAKLLKGLPPSYNLVWLGVKSSKDMEFVNKYAKYNGVEERFHMFPPLELYKIYECREYFDFGLSYIEPIYESYEYCLPNKLFEYINMNIPVICSPTVEQAKLVRRYNVGIVHSDSEEVSQLVERILKYKKNQNDFDKAKINLSWSREKKVLENIIINLTK